MEKLNGVKGYFQQLNRSLSCPRAHRRRFLSEARRMAEDYCHGNPDAAPEDICTFLGEPRELAQTYLETLPPPVLTRYRQSQRRLRQITIGFMILLIFVLGGWVYYFETTPLEITVTDTLIVYEMGN